MPTSSNDVLYLYALTPAANAPVDVDGLGAGVARVQCGAWTAVVDTVPKPTWTGDDADARLNDLRWVAPRACAHEDVVEHVMAHGPVYPARFGTLFSSAEHLTETVAAQHEALVAFFERVAQAEEWSVKGYLDRQKAVAFRTEAAGARVASSGTAYLQQRQQEEQVRASLDAWLSTVGDAVATALDAIPRALAARPPGTAPNESAPPVFHWAALVPTAQRSAFLQHVESLHGQYAVQGLRLEASGPWPPYTFRTAEGSPSL